MLHVVWYSLLKVQIFVFSSIDICIKLRVGTCRVKAVGCESVDMFHLAQWWALLGMVNNRRIS